MMMGGASDATNGTARVDDTRIGQLVRAGDTSGFGEAYERFSPAIYDYLTRLLRDPVAAEDVTQTAFTRAWERHRQLRDPERLRAWLFSTAHHVALDHLRRRRPDVPVEDQATLASSDPSPEQTAETRDAVALVWAAASSLEPRQYAVLDLTVRQGLSTPEVAQALDVSASHAAVLVHRAREALGNAVRYLLVARRRERCGQLAELVPAGVRALSSAQRSSVDHHMRRCVACRSMADRLTAPSQLLGLLPVLPAPQTLTRARDRLLAAARTGAPIHDRAANEPRAQRWHRGQLRRLIAASGGLLLLLGGATTVALVLRQPGAPALGGLARATPRASAAVPTVVVTPSTLPTPMGTVIAGLGTVNCVSPGPGVGPITLARDHTIWVGGSGSLYQFQPDGSFRAVRLPNHASGYPYTSAIAASPDGTIWFAQSSFSNAPGVTALYYFGSVTATGTVGDSALPAGDSIGALAVDSAGVVWGAATNGNSGQILRLTSNGVAARYSVGSGAQIGGLTKGPAGLLWFTLSSSNQVGSIDSSGNVRLFASAGTTGTNGYIPLGLTSDLSGNLWYDDEKFFGGVSADWWIGKMSSTGRSNLFLASKNASSEGGGVAVSATPGGSVWFVGFLHMGGGKSGVGLIGRITTNGSVSVFQLPDHEPSSVEAATDTAIWFTDGSGGVCRVQVAGS